MWRPMPAPHNTDVLVLMKDGCIDVANDGFMPDRYTNPYRGDPVFVPARTSWSPCHVGGYDWDWDYDESDIVGWMPLPSNYSPLRIVIDHESAL